MQAHIKRENEEISYSEFQRVVIANAQLNLFEVDQSEDGLTGELMHSSENKKFYKFSEKNDIGVIIYEYGKIYVNNIPDNICIELSNQLKAKLFPIYYHG